MSNNKPESQRTIDDVAAGPRRVVVDNQDVQTHSLKEHMEFEDWKRNREVADVKPNTIFGGIRVGKTSHPPTY